LVKESSIFADTKAKATLYDKEINVFSAFFDIRGLVRTAAICILIS